VLAPAALFVVAGVLMTLAGCTCEVNPSTIESSLTGSVVKPLSNNGLRPQDVPCNLESFQGQQPMATVKNECCNISSKYGHSHGHSHQDPDLEQQKFVAMPKATVLDAMDAG
jgi:hypothetical protein